MSVNIAIVSGNLGKDPEIRYTTGGDAVCNFSIATSERWTDKAGEKQEKTEWHNIVFFKRTAEIAGEYLKKGSKCTVTGRIQTRKWQDKEGNDRYTTEIVGDKLDLISSARGEGETEKPAAKPSKGGGSKPVSPESLDDDIPF